MWPQFAPGTLEDVLEPIKNGKVNYWTGKVGMEFEEAFVKAIADRCPVVIDTLIDSDAFVLPMLPPGGSIDDIIVRK